MGPSRFEEMVESVIESLPEDFARELERGNVGITVRDRPSPEELDSLGLSRGGTLLGLYHGVPPARRGTGYSLVLPDTITIYREPVERYAMETGRALDDLVREVVLHEIAHHFGLPDGRLRELGY